MVSERKNNMNKREIHVIIPLVEGNTEVEFYCEVRHLLLEKYPNTNKYEFLRPVNIKGIGNYKKNAARQFEHAVQKYIKSKRLPKNHKQKKSEVKKENTKYIFHAFMCIDTDVLDSSVKLAKFMANPPINEDETKKTIEDKNGIPHFIKAVHCIEDWFLEDEKGIIKYLKIDQMPDFKNDQSGVEKLRLVFAKANKLYTKGTKSGEFIKFLDINMILANHINDFKELIDLLK